MASQLTAEDIVPLIAALAPPVRTRLLHLIASSPSEDAFLYSVKLPTGDEFSTEDDPLGWDGEGWENFA